MRRFLSFQIKRFPKNVNEQSHLNFLLTQFGPSHVTKLEIFHLCGASANFGAFQFFGKFIFCPCWISLLNVSRTGVRSNVLTFWKPILCGIATCVCLSNAYIKRGRQILGTCFRVVRVQINFPFFLFETYFFVIILWQKCAATLKILEDGKCRPFECECNIHK